MQDFKIRISAETQQFAASANNVVSRLNQISSTQTVESGRQMGDHLGRGMEHGLHGRFRHLRHVVHLFAGVLGGIMGESFEKSFGRTAMAGITGAMGGLFIGGPWGALIGGVLGAGSHLLMSGREREAEETTKNLEHWNNLLGEIAAKKPDVIKALKGVGISDQGSLNRLATLPGPMAQQAIARNIMSQFPELQKLRPDYQPQAGSLEEKFFKLMGLPTTKDKLNRALGAMPQERGMEFMKQVDELLGGLDVFIKAWNAGPLGMPGKSASEKLSIANQMTQPIGFGTKDLPTPDSLARSGIFLTGGTGGESYQQTAIGLLSQIATKVDAVKEAVKSHEQTTKAQ